MVYPKSPVNTILVQIEKKYEDEIITGSGIKLYKDTSYNPEWNVTATGKVVSVPARLADRVTEAGTFVAGDSPTLIVPDVQVGDELFFGYSVIEDKDYINSPDAFREVEDSQSTLYSNSKKEQLRLQKLSKNLAICIWTDANNKRLGGYQGKPDECIKWLQQNFTFAGDDNLVYKNLLPYNGEDYWMVNYLEAKGVKRDGEIIMLAGNVLCEAPEESTGFELDENKLLHTVKKVDKSILTVVATGKPLKNEPELGLQSGDKIKVNADHVQTYTVWGKEYAMIDQRSIFGKL